MLEALERLVARDKSRGEYARALTTAHVVAELAGADGQDFSRIWLEAETADGRFVQRENPTIVQFNDGSAIVASDGGWDIEGDIEGSWEGERGPASGPAGNLPAHDAAGVGPPRRGPHT